ncbi:MAG: helix-turn-helix domain-containing protein [Bacillota bacterium]
MNYIEIVNDAVQYIESNLHRRLSLEKLASRYYLSPTHFYRIFRAVANQTLKSYILERKLSAAALALKRTDHKVVDIAFQYGFNSHEQFSRDFQMMFHVTPSRYRKENISVSLTERVDIIERNFINKNKDLIVAFYCREFKEIKLLGKEAHHNPVCSCEMDQLIRKVFDFFEEHIVQGTARRLFSVNGGDSRDQSRKFCFYGIEAEEYTGDRSGLAERIIPESRYAVFVYPEFMGLIFRTALKDLDKWLSLSGLEFNSNAGFDFIELFAEDYRQTGKFYLHVPVL